MSPSSEIAHLLHLGSEIVLGKIRWMVMFNHRVLLRIEGSTGLDVLGGEVDFNKLTSKNLGLILRATYEGPGELDLSALTPRNLPDIILKLRSAWRKAMPTPKPRKQDDSNEAESSISWIEAWGNARKWLELSDEEYLNYTPRMVQELSALHKEKVCQTEWMLAQIPAAVANWSMGRKVGSPPADPKHYMLHDWGLERERSFGKPVQSIEQQIAQLVRASTIAPEDKKILSDLIKPGDVKWNN